jgi:hypothetical protein
MSISDAQRLNFIVVRSNTQTQRGYITDKTGYEFLITRSNLAPECEGHVAEGDVVSGVAFETTVNDILIERGSNPIRERREFASEGVEPVGSWEPRTGTPQKFGNPDSGKFSHPKS